MELSCRHEIQIREDKSDEKKKTKPYQWLCYIRIKFVWWILVVDIPF